MKVLHILIINLAKSTEVDASWVRKINVIQDKQVLISGKYKRRVQTK